MTRPRDLNYGRHFIDESDINAVVAVLRGDLITQGPVVAQFEAALCERTGARHAIAVSSGTAGLHIACLAAGMKAGDLGVTSAMTFVASANAMRYCGGDVVLTDIDPQTLCMDPNALERILKDRPEISVIIPVHFAGLAADMKAIRRIAGSRIVIEDAAHALGADYDDGRSVGCGAYADMTIFSFHPVKPITTGEGGAVVTNDDELARRLRQFRTHGIEREAGHLENKAFGFTDGKRNPWYYEQQTLGFNYRLTDIQAALGVSQMSKLDGLVRRRREIVALYDQAFASMDGLTLPQNEDAQRARSGHHLYVVELDFSKLAQTRMDVMKALQERKVGTQVHYIPVYHHPYHSKGTGAEARDFPSAEAYYNACLSLPLFPDMDSDDVEQVINAVKEVVAL